jgi:phosphopantothenoylcysteine decarboxylase/phosphopantothenate--cysteine ligase
VTLVLGPSDQKISDSNVNVIHVTSAEDMLNAVQKVWHKMDIGIFSAAVADYKVEKPANKKIKKKDETFVLKLVKNPDILYWAGQNKTEHQYLVGFALETNNEIENAQKKLSKKNLDLLILNSLNDKGAGFKHDTNKVTFIKPNNNLIHFELKPKTEMGIDIVNQIEKDFNV